MSAMGPGETVREFLARICRRDLDGACELVTDDVEYDNVPMGKQFGPQGIKDLLGPMFGGGAGGFDEVDFVIHRQFAEGPLVCNERTDRFRRGDTWIDLPLAGIFEVAEDGRIKLWRDYFDLPTMTDAMAALSG